MPQRQTERGFNVYEEFRDMYGISVRIQESSSAEERRVWIFLDDNGLSTGAHLNEERVDKVIAALQEWKREHGVPTIHLKPTD